MKLKKKIPAEPVKKLIGKKRLRKPDRNRMLFAGSLLLVFAISVAAVLISIARPQLSVQLGDTLASDVLAPRICTTRRPRWPAVSRPAAAVEKVYKLDEEIYASLTNGVIAFGRAGQDPRGLRSSAPAKGLRGGGGQRPRRFGEREHHRRPVGFDRHAGRNRRLKARRAGRFVRRRGLRFAVPFGNGFSGLDPGSPAADQRGFAQGSRTAPFRKTARGTARALSR